MKLTFVRRGYVRHAPDQHVFADWCRDWEFDEFGQEWAHMIALRMLDYVEFYVDNPVSGDVELSA
jgi:hypothetical protein